MIIKYEKSGTVSALQNVLEEFSLINEVSSIIILAGNNDEFIPEKLDPILQSIRIPIIGGIFTAIVYNQQVYNSGSIIVGLPSKLSTHIISDLSNKNKDFEIEAEGIASEYGFQGNDTFLVFVDGYSSQLGALVDSLFSIFGVVNNFIGGGAGHYHPDHEMKSKPCLITNEGIVADSAVLGILQTQSEICVQHGWEKISSSYRVTSTKDNEVSTIDWKPAVEIYMQIMEQDSGRKVTRNNFFEIGKNYSLGIGRVGTGVIVREPLGIIDDSMIFTVPVPNEASVYVLKGSVESMLNATKKHINNFYKSISFTDDKLIFLVDCISRYYFMGDDFEQELAMVANKDIPVVGVLSIGEIANTGKNYIELYNKTCVIGLFDVK